MPRSATRTPVYLERGARRVFAGATEWPGWCRGGRDDTSALEALVVAAPRYARALARSRLGFSAPRAVSDLEVVERLRGDATTDFGAPGAMPLADDRTLDAAELRRSRAILEACWRAFDAAVRAARGKSLAKGPRGGGRELAKIVGHVLDADAGYLGALGWKAPPDARGPGADPRALHAAMLDGLAAASRGEIPARGPRGGLRWKPRFFVRRSAWHVLDHAWEIEDRSG